MPLYSYECLDCGAHLEILHAVGKTKSTCGLDCRRTGEGAFGQGAVRVQVSAANVSTGQPSFAEVQREALRQKALRKLGGPLTEADLNKLRDKGVAVYRKDGKDGWAHTGGGKNGEAPARIKPPREEDP